MESFNVVTPQGGSIATLFYLSFILSGLILALVVGVLIAVLVRFRARPGQAEPRQVTGNRRLEIGWTAGALALVTLLFVLSVLVMNRVQAAQDDPLRVQVIGRQWWWEYRYPSLNIVTANELHLPVDRPVQLEITGGDVIHSFWVPQFGWKLDGIPGKTNTMQVRLTQPGRFEGACSEYCGVQHAWMRVIVFAEPGDEFDAWARQEQAPAMPPTTAEAERGRDIFFANTCVSCHAIGGTTAQAEVGPDLTHFGRRETLGAGIHPNTPEQLAEWILHTQQVKPGVLMPSFFLSEQDLAALVAYLEGLQ